MNNFADIFTYASVGVRKSAGIVAHSGTTLGALESFCETDRICRTASSEGWILNWVRLESDDLPIQLMGHHTGGDIAVFYFWLCPLHFG